MRLTILACCAALAACNAPSEGRRTEEPEQDSQSAPRTPQSPNVARLSPTGADGGPAEGDWSSQVGAVSGVSARFVSEGRELVRVGCRADPPSLFVHTRGSENARKPIRIAFGDKTIDLEATDTGLEAATRLTPERVDLLDDGDVRLGELTLPPISPDALAALQRGCSQALAASTPEGARWAFFEADGRAVLAFALPNSDYPGPRFDCKYGGGVVRLTLQAVRSQPRRIVASAGSGRLEGQVVFEPDQLSGGEIWSTTLPADHPVLRGLQQTGSLRIDYPEPGMSYASDGAGRAVARFSAACAVSGQRVVQ